jgi:MoxR-like ATPase
MAGRKDYLEVGFKEDKQELQRTKNTLRQVSQIFGDIVIDDEWPYELRDREPIKPRAEKESFYSQSTNAMILFSIIATEGRTADFCPLLPNVILNEPISFGDNWEVFEKVWLKLIEKTTEEIAYHENHHITYSSSFGRDDPFTLAWMLEIDRSQILSKMPPEIKNRLLEIAKKRIERVFKTRGVGSLTEPLPTWWLTWESDAPSKKDEKKQRYSIDHAFPVLRYIQLYKCLDVLGEPPPNIPYSWPQYYLENRLHEQLSNFEIRDGTFDASEIVFALEGLLCLKPLSVSRALLDRIFHVISESQDRNPYWRPIKPFVATPQGHVLFPISLETASSLLRCCNLIEKHKINQLCFSQNIDLFRRYSEWLRSRISTGYVTTSGDKKINFTGWHSEHVHIHPGIHVWETSQVMLFLSYYSSVFDRYMARSSLEAANLFEVQPWKEDQKYYHVQYWNKEKTTVEPLAYFDNIHLQAYAYALRHFVAPRPSPPEKPHLSTSGVNSDYDDVVDMQYSMLLYGPPGTGKTVFAEEICKALKWPLVTVTPSDFIRGGESEVEARAKMIFEVLEAQSNVIILFDEIDRMILDRASILYSEQSDIFQFMTPGMLTKLRNLRRKSRAIFIIATNYEERIDKAAKRQGRLDSRLLMPPPNMAGRIQILRQIISERIDNNLKADFKTKASELLLPVAEQTRLKSFAELKELVVSAASGLKKEEKDKPDKIIKTLTQFAKEASPASISLMTYRPRFESDNFPQKPYREFFVLLFLNLESGGELQNEDEKELAEMVLRMFLDIDEEDWKSMNTKEKRKKIKDEIDREFRNVSNISEAILEGLYPNKS